MNVRNITGGAFLLGGVDPRRVFVPEMLTDEDRLIGKRRRIFCGRRRCRGSRRSRLATMS